MPEKPEIKYWYKSEKLSEAASRHIFHYLSACCKCRFVEDKESPVIWRDSRAQVPASVKLILSDSSDETRLMDSIGERGKEITFISPDPVQNVFEKLSIKTELGPYSDSVLEPSNSPEESLSGIIKGFYNRLREYGIIQSTNIYNSLWPEGHGFAVAVTHDVDITRRSVRGSIRLLFKRDVPGGFRGLFDSVKSLLGLSRNPYDGITDWIDEEKNRNLKSTFFVFPGNRHNRNDPKYDIRQLEKSLEYMGENGHELALHSGIECYKGNHIAESREILNGLAAIPVTGIRPHYLSAWLPEYWRAASENGFEYSSCLGFDEDIGFFRGIDLPIIPFDRQNNVALNIVEIPIGMMDCGLLENDIVSAEKGKRLIDRVESAGGILVLDWHQRTLYNADYPGWAAVFFELIDYARNKGAYFATMKEMARILKNGMADNN